ncbi:hypothetical protein ACFX2I_004814 [Malus domestica]
MIGNLCYEVVIYERRNYLSVPSRHYAAWGEELVLAFRPGEIIPSYGLRDMDQVLGRELVISGYGRIDNEEVLGRELYLFGLRINAPNPGVKTLPQQHLRILSNVGLTSLFIQFYLNSF